MEFSCLSWLLETASQCISWVWGESNLDTFLWLSDLLTHNFNNWSWSSAASLNAVCYHYHFLFRVGPVCKRFEMSVFSSQNWAKKKQLHRCRQKPPPSISVCTSLKWFSLLTHEHVWLPFGPLLVSVLFSPALGQTFIINGCSLSAGCHSIVDFLQYFFLYCSWLLIFLFHPLSQLPKIPHVL